MEKELLIMKFVLLMLSVLLSAGCSSTNTSNTVNLNEDKSTQIAIEKTESDSLTKAIALARKNKDYRLLVTSGRSMSIPGIKGSDYQTMIELCGKKYTATTGDVLTSEEQRQERKKVVTYMRQYNEQMSVICQENNIK